MADALFEILVGSIDQLFVYTYNHAMQCTASTQPLLYNFNKGWHALSTELKGFSLNIEFVAAEEC